MKPTILTIYVYDEFTIYLPLFPFHSFQDSYVFLSEMDKRKNRMNIHDQRFLILICRHNKQHELWITKGSYNKKLKTYYLLVQVRQTGKLKRGRLFSSTGAGPCFCNTKQKEKKNGIWNLDKNHNHL